MSWRTRLAKALFWVSGRLSRIRTSQRTYSWNPDAPDDAPMRVKFPPAGRMKLPCHLSVELLSWAAKIDRIHWDHWALDHKDCTQAYRCTECGGLVDPDD